MVECILLVVCCAGCFDRQFLTRWEFPLEFMGCWGFKGQGVLTDEVYQCPRVLSCDTTNADYYESSA